MIFVKHHTSHSHQLTHISIFTVIFQCYLHKQVNSKSSYNLVLETLRFLDCICGVTTGGLVLLSLYIHANNVTLINQCLSSLTEYCQGPCRENQVSGSYKSCDLRVEICLSLFTCSAAWPRMSPVVSTSCSCLSLFTCSAAWPRMSPVVSTSCTVFLCSRVALLGLE